MEHCRFFPLTWVEALPLYRLYKIVLNAKITINYGFNPGSDSRWPYRAGMWWPPSLHWVVTIESFGAFSRHGAWVGPCSHGRPTVQPPFCPSLLFSLSHGSAMVFGPKRHILTKQSETMYNRHISIRCSVSDKNMNSIICIKVKIVFHMCGLPKTFTVKWLKIYLNISTYVIVGVIG